MLLTPIQDGVHIFRLAEVEASVADFQGQEPAQDSTANLYIHPGHVTKLGELKSRM